MIQRVKVDEILNYIEDVINVSLMPTFAVPEGEERNAARAKLISEDGGFTVMFKRLTSIIKANGSGYLVGPILTIADLKVVGSIILGIADGHVDGLPKTLFQDSYPELNELLRRVNEHPKIAAKRAAHD